MPLTAKGAEILAAMKHCVDVLDTARRRLDEDLLRGGDANDDNYPVEIRITLSEWEDLAGFIKFLKYIQASANSGHSFMIAADESPDGDYKQFGKQAAGAICFIDGDGSDKVGRIWLNGEEVK